MPRNEQRFSLKDHLFNAKKVAKIASEIRAVFPTFKQEAFEKEVLASFSDLELMERIYWMRECLKKYLPEQYTEAVSVLLRSLPPEADPHKQDNDFGDFIYAPYGDFVATYGCTKKELQFSLDALKTLTKRFSVETPMRVFINAYPEETYRALGVWASDPHYHVRRAASESTRPFLPWAKKITPHYTDAVPILNQLYADATRYVTRSVANHVNDISKIDPDGAIRLLTQWQKDGLQHTKEMDYITTHALRTLIKKGNKKALRMLGYHDAVVQINNLMVETPIVRIGDACTFSFDVTSKSTRDQQLMIDYVLHFRKANGQTAPKTHKLAKKVIKAGEKLTVVKTHPLRRMTTRKLYAGVHTIELQINGTSYGTIDFELIV